MLLLLRDIEQSQGGLGEPVDRRLRDAAGVALVQPQQPERVSGNGSQRKLRAGNGKVPGGLPGLDVTQGTRRLPARCAQHVEPCAGEEAGDVGVSSPAARGPGGARITPRRGR